MTHSVKNRRKRERLHRSLNKRVKALAKLARKQHKDPHIVSLPDVSLGDLRGRFKHFHYVLHPALRRQLPKFERIPSDPAKPLFIYGSDGGLLGCRVRLHDPEAIHNLYDSIQPLPPSRHYKHRGIKRSEYQTRHYAVWASYSPRAMLSREFRDDGPAGHEFINGNKRIWDAMSGLLGQVAPGVFKEFQNYPCGSGLDRLCGAFAGCVINNGGNNPNQTEIHRDVKEAQYGFSCIVSCGSYQRGALVCHDIKKIIEMDTGDLFLFPDCLIHHNNEDAEGIRCSVVGFTQENMYDLWHREYNMRLRRKERKRRTAIIKRPKK